MKTYWTLLATGLASHGRSHKGAPDMHITSRRRGFSLVEFIIAIAVLVFGVYGVYNSFIGLRAPSTHRLNVAQARLLAQQKLEELRASEAGGLSEWSPGKDFRPVEAMPKFLYLPEISTRADGIVEITVSVGWDSEGPDFQGKLVTVKGARNS